jgi:hypothetical protein
MAFWSALLRPVICPFAHQVDGVVDERGLASVVGIIVQSQFGCRRKPDE